MLILYKILRNFKTCKTWSQKQTGRWLFLLLLVYLTKENRFQCEEWGFCAKKFFPSWADISESFFKIIFHYITAIFGYFMYNLSYVLRSVGLFKFLLILPPRNVRGGTFPSLQAFRLSFIRKKAETIFALGFCLGRELSHVRVIYMRRCFIHQLCTQFYFYLYIHTFISLYIHKKNSACKILSHFDNF